MEQNELPFFTPAEVALHNKENDLWVSVLGRVLDLTSVIKKHKGETCIRPLLAFAGKDISHMFDKYTGDIRYGVHPVTQARVPAVAHGPLPGLQPTAPSTRWRPARRLPWWRDPALAVGHLTARARTIRVVNMLTGEEHTMLVCCEESVRSILERERHWNSHVGSYTCKHEGRLLELDKTLEENGIPDERESFAAVGLPADTHVPALGLYFNDDLSAG